MWPHLNIHFSQSNQVPSYNIVKQNISEYGSKIVHSNLYWLLNYIENYVKPCMAIIVSAPCRQNG